MSRSAYARAKLDDFLSHAVPAAEARDFASAAVRRNAAGLLKAMRQNTGGHEQ